MKMHRISAALISMILSAALLPANIPANETGTETAIEAEGEVSQDQSYKVSLPSGQEGVLVSAPGSTNDVKPGSSFTFYVAPAEGWTKGSDYSVKAGEQLLKPVTVIPENQSASDKQKQTASGADADGGSTDGTDQTQDETAGSPQQSDSENGQQDSVPDEKKDTADSAAGGQTPGSLEKKLIEQGYEKYVITNISGNITVTVSGVVKSADSDSKGSADQDGKAGENARTDNAGQNDPAVEEELSGSSDIQEDLSEDIPDAGSGENRDQSSETGQDEDSDVNTDVISDEGQNEGFDEISDVVSDEGQNEGFDEISDVVSDEGQNEGLDETSDVVSDEGQNEGFDETSDVVSDEGQNEGFDENSDVIPGENQNEDSEENTDVISWEDQEQNPESSGEITDQVFEDGQGRDNGENPAENGLEDLEQNPEEISDQISEDGQGQADGEDQGENDGQVPDQDPEGISDQISEEGQGQADGENQGQNQGENDGQVPDQDPEGISDQTSEQGQNQSDGEEQGDNDGQGPAETSDQNDGSSEENKNDSENTENNSGENTDGNPGKNQDQKESGQDSSDGASVQDSSEKSTDSEKADSSSGKDSAGQAVSGDKKPSSGSTDAVSVTGYSLWVGGIQATSDNTKDLLGNGQVSYDDKNNILTLKNAVISGHKKAAAPVYYKGSRTLTIAFSGNCTISDSDEVSGIVCENSSLTLDGSGTLTVKTAAPLSHACIQADKGDLTILGGAVKAFSTGNGSGLSAARIMITNDAERVQAESLKKALSAEKSVSIGDHLGISLPDGGLISSDKKTITDETGKTAVKVVIEPLQVFNVTFEAGEGTGTMEAENVLEGRMLKLPVCSFTAPQCKTFSGWEADGKAYAEGDSLTITKSLSVTAQWKDSHRLEKIPRKEPLCLKPGNIEYYKCADCGKCFSDSSGTKKIEEADTVLAALGHKWDKPVYTWASGYTTVSAKRVCLNDSSHIEKETVKTKKTGTDPTCTEKGHYKYTAEFSNKAFKRQIKNVTKSALGHLWEKHEFLWDQYDDGTMDAMCRLICSRNPDHEEIVDAVVKTSITLPGNLSDGKMTCTATSKFEGKTYTGTIEKTISPAGTTGYKFKEAPDSWTKDSDKSMKFRVERSHYDLITYKAFSSVTIDGNTVSNSYYSTSEGSLKLKIDHEYLDKLAVGNHTMVIEFKDGAAKHTFKVKEASGHSSPRTEDRSDPLLWALGFAACAAMAAVLLTVRRRESRKKHR